ncbi:hypothetical protein EHS25_007012 [Saitozyma podzolica]|uniref:Uncharacterized protein n=1 Tax=Saitozyma podzolica TaxID=1890683 RepID=A0A427XPU1_9TREE|nr:hypothetical protein EHS25_007012 [Saitozyma podzolica]
MPTAPDTPRQTLKGPDGRGEVGFALGFGGAGTGADVRQSSTVLIPGVRLSKAEPSRRCG